MKLNKMKKEELELYSYNDLTKMILVEMGKPQTTPVIFKKICKLLELSDSEYEDKIGDYYTSLTTDKDFVLLDSGKWDLRDHHPASVLLTDEEIEDEEEIEEEPIIEENIEEDIDDDIDDIEEEDEDDLTILSEEEIED